MAARRHPAVSDRGNGAPSPGRVEKVQIEVQDLWKAYAGHEVLKGVDLVIERGRTNVVIGGSGAGKTVLLRHLIGLERPDRGHIVVDGEDIVAMNDVELNRVRKKYGMVFQGAALFDSMSVFDNVAFPLREHARLSAKEIKERVLDKLAVLGLEGADKQFPGEISGGMRKRVGVARALIMEPEILIYDEPTTGLDPLAARNVDDLIADMQGRFQVTSIVISHDMATTFRVGHRINLLSNGRIVASGTPIEFVHSTDPEVVRFIRSSGVKPEALP